MAWSRRAFLSSGFAAAAATTVMGAERKFTIAFVPGSIGINADQGRSIELASKHGFESVEPFGKQFLAEGSAVHVDALEAARLKWAAARLSVSLRVDEAAFVSGLAELPAEAKALRQAGVDRVGTAIASYSEDLNYLDNFKIHVDRLRKGRCRAGRPGLAARP